MKKSIILLLLVLALVLVMIPCALAEEDALPASDPADVETEVKDEDDDPYYLALTPANFPDERLRNAIQSRLQAYVTQKDNVPYLSKQGVLGVTQFDFYPFYNIYGVQDDPQMKYTFTTIKGLELFPNLVKVDLRGRFMTSLDLSAFPNFTWVDCSSNKLTSLTVSESNVSLQTLNCSYNALQTLDVSKLTGLITLNCSHSHITRVTLPNTSTLKVVNAEWSHMQEFTLPSAVKLSELYLKVSQLTALDLSGQTNLEKLDCSHCKITAMALEDMPLLNTLDLRDNKLATLTLSNLPVLPELMCSKNQLTALTVSGLPKLKKVDCSENLLASLTLSQLPLLTEVDCSKNQLSSLDCSPVSSLQILICEDNQLTSLTLGNPSQLLEIHASTNQLAGVDLSGCANLKKLEVAYNEITALDLSNCPSVYYLAVAGNRMAYLDLADHPTQLYVHAMYNTPDRETPQRVTGKGMVSEGSYFFDMKSLIPVGKLRVTSGTEGVTYDSGTGIMRLPSDLTSFKYGYGVKGSYGFVVEVTVTEYQDQDTLNDPHYLALTEDYIPDANLRAALTEKLEAQGLVQEEGGVKYVSWSNAKKVKSLDLSLDPNGVKWADLMESDPTQYAANIRPFAFSSLNGLTYFTQLTSLKIRQRSLTTLGISALTKLTYLDCSYNEITFMDLPLGLITLDMSHNKLRGVTLEAFTRLTDAQCSYNNLTSLYVPNSIVRFSCANNRLTSLYLRNKTALVEVDCSGNQITDLYLEDNTRLEKLTVDGNRIAELDFNKNTALTHLSCANNSLTALKVDMLSALVSLDCSGNHLSALDVSRNTKLQTLRCANNQLSCLELGVNALLPVDDTALLGQRLTTRYLFDVNDRYTCYLGPLVNDTHRVTVTTEGAVYDPDTGAVTFDTEAASVDYLYDTAKGMLAVTVPLETVVAEPPTITTQPKDVTVKSGSKAKFTVKAKEKGVTFQWYGRSEADAAWTLLPGETRDTLIVVGGGPTNWWRYRCLVRTRDGGEVYSDTAVLTVILAPPVFKTQPMDQIVKSGTKAKFTAKASGKNLHYQWYVIKPGKGWVQLEGETKPELTFFASMDMNNWEFSCNAWNDDGDEYSDQAILIVTPQPASIKTQPKDAKVKSGAKARFSVKGAGPNLSYQWFTRPTEADDWTEMAGETKADLSLVGAMDLNGAQFYCHIWNADGSVDSAAATLTVTPQPASIKTQPKSVTVKSGAKARFSVKGAGPNLSYQWFTRPTEADDWTEMAGETKADLNLVGTMDMDGFEYYCHVWNADGSADSAVVTLTVTPQPASIKTQPKSVTVKSGAKARFSVKGAGPNLSYQWFTRPSETDDWTKMAGETKADLSLVGAMNLNGSQYYCHVWNADGSADSAVVTLTVTPQPASIKTQPKSTTVKSGAKARFSVKGSGPDLRYLWFTRPTVADEWTEMAGETKADLSLVGAMNLNGSQYYCHVWNADGSADSAVVTLTVTPQPPKFSTQPKDAKVKPGEKATFKAKASGKNVTYQWYYRTSEDGEWILLEGETGANLIVTATEGNFGFQYRCRAQNADGEVFSKPASLLRK